jgi:predicted Zn-dependent peptidase
VSRVQEIQRRTRETSLRQNAYWAGQLMAYDRQGMDFARMLEYDARVDGLTAEIIQEAARTLLNEDRYVRVSLVPAG